MNANREAHIIIMKIEVICMDNYALVNDIASVWKYADEMFPAFGSISIDWDGAFGAFLPRALAAKDEKEAQLLLCEFLNLLEDGHTDYTPPRAFRDGIGYLPFEPDYAGGNGTSAARTKR